jgi:hypothetical protein
MKVRGARFLSRVEAAAWGKRWSMRFERRARQKSTREHGCRKLIILRALVSTSISPTPIKSRRLHSSARTSTFW